MSDRFPNGKWDNNETEQDARLAEAIRKAAHETMPDAGFVARLEAQLRAADQTPFASDASERRPYSVSSVSDINQKETVCLEEIPAMQAQKIAVRNRETPLVPLPLAAAITAAIAIGALILMMSLTPRPTPEIPVAGLIQATETPIPPTVDPLQLTATAIIVGATQTANAPTSQPDPLIQTAVAIIAQATAYSLIPPADRTATHEAYWSAYATERAVGPETREFGIQGTRGAIFEMYTATADARLSMTATPTLADPTHAAILSSNAPILVQALGQANVRFTPDVNSDSLGTIYSASWFVATARLGSWIQIEYAESANGYGWVFADLVRVQGDVNNLSEAQPMPPIPVGGWLSDFSQDAFDAMRVRNLTWVALPLPYRLVIDGQSDPMIPVAKIMITAAQARGYKVMLNIFGDAADFGDDYDSYVEAFAAFNGSIAALGPDAIQVWYEPNIDHSWTTDDIDPVAYVQMLEAAYTAIKDANPDVTVITAALAPTGAQDTFPGQVVNDDVYYQGMADGGAANFADCIGVEYVEGVVSPTETSGDPRGEYPTYYLVPSIQRAAAPFRESGLPVCVTALGYASFEFAQIDDAMPAFEWARGTSWQEQYELTQQAIETLAALSSVRVEMAMIYRLDSMGDHLTELYAIWRTNPPPMFEATPTN